MEVKCKTKDTLPLDQLVEFQGNLKERSSDDYAKIEKSMKKTWLRIFLNGSFMQVIPSVIEESLFHPHCAAVVEPVETTRKSEPACSLKIPPNKPSTLDLTGFLTEFC